MENLTLKKKLSSYTTDKGYLKNVTDDILFELLKAWENWTGPSKDFYRSLGFSGRQMASLIGKAKRMQREGQFGSSDFKEIKVETVEGMEIYPSLAMEVLYKDGRIIRFSNVDFLVDFLKKAA